MAAQPRWFCSQCGAPNPGQQSDCYSCATPRVQVIPQPAPAAAPPVAPAQAIPITQPTKTAGMGVVYILLSVIVVLLAVIALRPMVERYLQEREKESDRAAIIRIATEDCRSTLGSLSALSANPGPNTIAEGFLKEGSWEVSFRSPTQAEAVLNVPSMGALAGFRGNYEKRDTGWICVDCE